MLGMELLPLRVGFLVQRCHREERGDRGNRQQRDAFSEDSVDLDDTGEYDFPQHPHEGIVGEDCRTHRR